MLHHDLSVLREVAEVHVAYELRAMVATGALRLVAVEAVVAEARPLDPAQVVTGSVLVSHLVHVRNLHGFLLRRASGLHDPDEVVAEHFFDGDWVGPAALSKAEVKEIHSRVVHVSSRRSTPLSPDATWAGIAPAWAPSVVGAFRRFVDDLAAVHPDRAAWFVPALEVAEAGVLS